MLDSTPYIVIIYDTKTRHTFSMSKLIQDAIVKMGVSCDIVLARAGVKLDWEKITGFAMGSPTISHSVSIDMQNFLKEINESQIRGKIAGAFGTYAWSGESADILNSFLEQHEVRIVAGPLKILQAPKTLDIQRCFRFGQRLAEAAKLLTPYNSTGEE